MARDAVSIAGPISTRHHTPKIGISQSCLRPSSHAAVPLALVPKRIYQDELT